MDTQRANSILYVAREMLADIKHCNGVGKLFPPGTWWRKGEKFFLAHGDGVGSVYDGQGKSVAFMIIYPAKDSNVLWAMVEKYPYSRDSDNGWEPIEGCPFPDNEDIRQSETHLKQVGIVAEHMSEVEEAIRFAVERIVGS